MITEFTPLQSTIGGILIGCAAVLLMLLHGRIMGATGVLEGVIRPTSAKDWSWRAAVLAGMVASPALVTLAMGHAPALLVPASTPMLLLGAVIVGIGVTLGSGCTSGHGVCGNARLSIRSIVATLTFMATTGITVFVLRHVIGSN